MMNYLEQKKTQFLRGNGMSFTLREPHALVRMLHAKRTCGYVNLDK